MHENVLLAPPMRQGAYGCQNGTDPLAMPRMIWRHPMLCHFRYQRAKEEVLLLGQLALEGDLASAEGSGAADEEGFDYEALVALVRYAVA